MIEALRTSILEPHDHLHIKHERVALRVRSALATISALEVVAPLLAQAAGDEG